MRRSPRLLNSVMEQREFRVLPVSKALPEFQVWMDCPVKMVLWVPRVLRVLKDLPELPV